MLDVIIKYFSIFLCTILIVIKILNDPSFRRFKKYYLGIILPITTCVAVLCAYHFTGLSYIISILFLWIALCFFNLRPQTSFIATIIAFGISFSFYSLSSFLCAFIILPIFQDPNAYPYTLLAILSSFLQYILTFNFLKIRRFQKGMPFLFSTSSINFATIVCMIFLSFYFYISFDYSSSTSRLLLLLGFIIMLCVIIFWWQAQLIKAYKRRILLREIESLRTELEEKEEQIAVLSKQNEDLGRLIHKDNKLIPSMVHSVKTYLATDFSDASAAIERGNALLIELHEVSRHRSNVITEIHGPKHKPYATGCMAVDTMLNFMRDKLCDKHVDFSVHFGVDLKQYVPSSIADMDLGHLLSDLIDNAYNATSNCDNPIIVIQFYEAENSLVLEIADNGVPFEANSLLNFGLEAITTHSDTGGHGFGLLDIWRHKTNYRATLHIDEYGDDAPYSKKISLIFNKKNKYTIRTWRKDELERLSQRTDLQVYDTTV